MPGVAGKREPQDVEAVRAWRRRYRRYACQENFLALLDQLGGIHPECLGQLPGRLGPYEIPAAVLEAVDRFRRDAGLLSQLADAHPAGGP